MGISILSEDGETVIIIPSHLEVCWRCSGRGRHVNPAIDGNGISAEQWESDWSYEERQDYLEGRYDVLCLECKGQNVVAVADEDDMSPEVLREWRSHLAFEAELRREERMRAAGIQW